jgi:hypothetical protein
MQGGGSADLHKTASEAQEEIAERVRCSERTVGGVLENSGFRKIGNIAKIAETAISSEEEADAADDADDAAGLRDGRHRPARPAPAATLPTRSNRARGPRRRRGKEIAPTNIQGNSLEVMGSPSTTSAGRSARAARRSPRRGRSWRALAACSSRPLWLRLGRPARAITG